MVSQSAVNFTRRFGVLQCESLTRFMTFTPMLSASERGKVRASVGVAGDSPPRVTALESRSGMDARPDPDGEELTPRELEILRLIAQGLENKEIAE